MGGLIVIVLLSLVGIIFPVELLPYPTEVLVGILVVAAIALVVSIGMWRGRVADRRKADEEAAEKLLRTGLNTLGHQDDAAEKLAQKYEEKD